MKSFARRRRERIEATRPFVEDPENEARRRDCAAQMAAFDRMTPEARARIASGKHDFDTVDAVCQVMRAGPGPAARRALKERELIACDLSLEELVSLDLVGR